jgi:hypothetical protein
MRFVDDGWLLLGEPPGELIDLEHQNPPHDAGRAGGRSGRIG